MENLSHFLFNITHAKFELNYHFFLCPKPHLTLQNIIMLLFPVAGHESSKP